MGSLGSGGLSGSSIAMELGATTQLPQPIVMTLASGLAFLSLYSQGSESEPSLNLGDGE